MTSGAKEEAKMKLCDASQCAILGISNKPRNLPALPGPVECDRGCLQGMVDQYLVAVVAHDPQRLPLGTSIRYTENGQELPLGDGFWGTASAVGRYKHYFLDPRTQQAGLYAVLKENGNPVILALRLKLQGRRINEIETVIARSGSGVPPATNMAARVAGKASEHGPLHRLRQRSRRSRRRIRTTLGLDARDRRMTTRSSRKGVAACSTASRPTG
jgi:hypothetical protein